MDIYGVENIVFEH